MASNSGKRKLSLTDLNLEEDGIEITRTTGHSSKKVQSSASQRSLSPPSIAKAKMKLPEQRLPTSKPAPRRIDSPIRLTKVEGLPGSVNVDTVSLEDILGNPLIKGCWAFNYLTDIDFLLSKFDEDIRNQVKLTVVHGFWKREDANLAALKEAAAQHENVQEVAAYMPEPFGTHHTKCLVITRHDDIAQIIVMTTNFIAQDWRMTQAAWISPELPLLEKPDDPRSTDTIGSGSKFKFDFLCYLKTYKGRLAELVTILEKHDFSSIKAALVASVPSGNSKQHEIADANRTNWGWPGLRNLLGQIRSTTNQSEIVVQVSSIATLGVQDTYLRKTLFAALENSSSPLQDAQANFHLIFPIAEEIRRSISGYECGTSIHLKTQSEQNKKQLSYLKPLLCQWAGDTDPNRQPATDVRRAGRRRAGPHVKTYIRFSDSSMTSIDWALVTSANLSTQAWGATANKTTGDVRICSYELGVLIWPDLFKEHADEGVEMVPVFLKDQPDQTASDKTKVGFRMPYDLPLVPYLTKDEPWCATKADTKEDWMGRAWPGF